MDGRDNTEPTSTETNMTMQIGTYAATRKPAVIFGGTLGEQQDAFGREGETVEIEGAEYTLGTRASIEWTGDEWTLPYLIVEAPVAEETPEIPAAAPTIIYRRSGSGWEIESDTALAYGDTVEVTRRDGSRSEQIVGTEQPAVEGRFRYAILADEQATETVSGRIDRDAMQRLAATARYSRRGAYGAWDRDEAYADAPESGWER